MTPLLMANARSCPSNPCAQPRTVTVLPSHWPGVGSATWIVEAAVPVTNQRPLRNCSLMTVVGPPRWGVIVMVAVDDVAR